MSSKILKYIPNEALEILTQWFWLHKFHLKISKPRRTKLGDFRPSNNQQPHRISINGDLNKYHFLITLTHEVAHLITWNRFGKKALPHGKEWKENYIILLEEILQQVEFPVEIKEALVKHMAKPKATSCTDTYLLNSLRLYDEIQNKLILCEIKEGDCFLLQGKRKFKKGKLRRTRYLCTELTSGKPYLIHQAAEVVKCS